MQKEPTALAPEWRQVNLPMGLRLEGASKAIGWVGWVAL